MSGFAARDVLDELDADAEPRRAAFFPDFDHGYNYHVDQRLTGYADESQWVIVIEQLSVNPRSCGMGVHTTLNYHGTGINLSPQPGWQNEPVRSITVLEDGPSGRLVLEDNASINLNATDVRIRGQVVPIRTDPNYYWARRIDVGILTHKKIDEMIRSLPETLSEELAEHTRRNLESMREDVGRFRLRTWHLARGLVPEYRDLLLATEEERRRGVAAGLQKVLEIDEWEHPRLLAGERPSSCESFRMIARVLATGDPTLYRPTESPNTHWSNWAQAGSL